MFSNCLNQYYFREERYGRPWHLSGQLEPCWFRTPQPDWSKPYVACVGASQTFGRRVATPWPALLPVRTANFGLGDAGPGTFLSSAFLEVLNKATAVVLQVMTARNEPTAHWRPVRNCAGLLCAQARAYRTGQIQQTDHWWKRAIERPHVAVTLREQAQQAWVRHYRALIAQLKPPVVVLWISKRKPDEHVEDEDGCRSLHAFYNHYPHFVNGAMLTKAFAAAAAHVRVSEWFDGYYPPQNVHLRIARHLATLDMRSLGAGQC